MTSEEAWVVSKRVLGTFFVVHGFLYFAEAIRMVGIVIPPGGSIVGYISASLLQGAIALVAGAVLLRGGIQGRASTSAPMELSTVTRTALQLLGVFFFVEGIVYLASPVAAVFLGETIRSYRGSEIAAGLVECLAGALLIFRPGRVASRLSEYGGA